MMGAQPRTGYVAKPGQYRLTRVKPQRRGRLCGSSGKVAWLTEADALIALANLLPGGGVYRCPACGFWHITSREQG